MDTQLSSLHTRALFLMKPTMKVQRKIPISYKPGYISVPFIIEQLDWISHPEYKTLGTLTGGAREYKRTCICAINAPVEKIRGGKLVLNKSKLVKLKLCWSLVAVYWVYRENGKFIDP